MDEDDFYLKTGQTAFKQEIKIEQRKVNEFDKTNRGMHFQTQDQELQANKNNK